MSRTATTNLAMGVFDDGDDAGAGSKTVSCASGGVGLNANWVTLDNAVGTEHDAAGAHKANVIKGSNLIQTGGNSCVDGSSLEFNANAIRVKALGIATGMIAADAVDKTKLAADCAGTGLDQDADGSLKVHVDAATIDFSGDELQVQHDGLNIHTQIYSGQEVAGLAAGNTITENAWVETSATYVIKVGAYCFPHTNTKYLKASYVLSTDAVPHPSSIKMEIFIVGAGVASGSVEGTSEGSTLSLDISGLSLTDNNCVVKISTKRGATEATTCTLQYLSIRLTTK